VQQTATYRAGNGMRRAFERDVEVPRAQLKITKPQVTLDNEAFFITIVQMQAVRCAGLHPY